MLGVDVIHRCFVISQVMCSHTCAPPYSAQAKIILALKNIRGLGKRNG
jgi:hypothetical protein